MTFELGVSQELQDLSLRVRSFIDETVIPQESALSATRHGVDEAFRDTLQNAALDAGIFAPTAPTRYGGLGLDHREQSLVLEESGRSLLGPTAMNCAAPDEGNILLLEKVATDEQKERFLAPLARGEVRSAFCMTEPAPGAGADPSLLSTTATAADGRWRINGKKWFITGAQGSSFSIVMARTEGGATMFLVPEDTPGMTVTRTLNTLDRAFSGGHCVVEFTDCEVGEAAVLGEVDKGFEYAQVRLGPARLTHCMRWLGAARRAHEEAMKYVVQRDMFNTTLDQLGMAQKMIADNELDISSSRMMIWRAAWALDQGSPAREETSSAKIFVAEAANRIVDNAMQLCGGFGVSDDSPIPHIYNDIRPFRIYDGPSEVHRWSLAKRAARKTRAGILTGDWSNHA